MYNVNTKRIEEVLNHLEKMQRLLRELTAKNDDAVLADPVATAALERAMHLSIEAVADVGNALIDGFIMRDPGSYADIVEILRDERVISDADAKQLSEVVSFRKHLVNGYTSVPVAEMIGLARASLETLARFAPAVRAYIKQELF
jgi:uncharacterized protein YutE (UPF0331/DUF86 family)